MKNLICEKWNKSFKEARGLNIHKGKSHPPYSQDKSSQPNFRVDKLGADIANVEY